MSQFENGNAPNAVRRVLAPPAVRLEGVVESRNAPGLEVPPPVSEGVALAQQALQALGALGQVGNAVGHLGNQLREEQNRRDYEARRAQAEQDRMDKEAKHAEIGAAADHGAVVLPGLDAGIESGAIVVPEGMAIEDFAIQLAREQAGEGFSADYTDAMEHRLAPHLAASLYRRDSTLRKQGIQENTLLIQQGAAGVTDPDELRSKIDAIRAINPDASEKAARDTVVVYALDYAAKSGNRDAFAAAKSLVPEHENRPEVARAELDLERVLDAQRRETTSAFRNEIADLYNGPDEGPPVPPSVVREKIMAAKGRVDDTVIRSELDHLEAREAESSRAAMRALKAGFIDFERGRIIDRFTPLLAAGAVTGGAPLLRDQTIALPDGTVHTFKADDLAQEIRSNEWARIDAAVGDPKRNLALKIDWLSKNPGVKDPGLAGEFEGIAQRVSADATDATIGPAALRAFDLFRTTGAMNQGVRNANMQERDLDFFRTAEFVHENLRDVSPGTAMVIARKAMDRDPASARLRDAQLTGSLLTKAASDVAGSAANSAGVQSVIGARAKAYMLASGVGEAAAIKRAAEDVKADFTSVNGWMVRTRGRDLNGIDLGAVGGFVIDDYLQGREHEERKNYTIIPDAATGGWRVSFMDTGLPAEGSPLYFDRDLHVIQGAWSGILDSEARETAYQAERADRKGRMAVARVRLSQVGLALAAHSSDNRDVVLSAPVNFDIFGHDDPVEPDAPAEPPHLKGVLAFVRGVRERERQERARRETEFAARRADAPTRGRLGEISE